MISFFFPLTLLKRYFLPFFLIIGIYIQQIPANAQFIDSISYQAETIFTGSPKQYQPFWILSDRYGIFDDQQFNGLVRAGVAAPYRKAKKFGIAFGIDFLGKPNFNNGLKKSILPQQGYVKVKYGILELRAGREETTMGTHTPSLSTGSLAISRNARPLPMIVLAVPNYSNIPFTKGYLQFKGNFGHGWFEKDRDTANPYLHLKSFYLKAGGKLPVNVYAGIIHYAMWGGKHPSGTKIPRNFREYLNVLVGSGSTDSTFRGEKINALGNHLGIVDFGVNINLKDFKILVYNQSPFEDKSGVTFRQGYRDRLLGINMRTIKPYSLIKNILYEYVYTKYQSSPGLPNRRLDMDTNYGFPYDGRDDYYNNYLYHSGWTYMGKILGTPLFMTKDRAELFLDNLNSFDKNIVNNRIVAHHLGIEGFATKTLHYRLLATFTRNFGTYAGLNNGIREWLTKSPDFEQYLYAFKKPLNQSYFMIEALTKLPAKTNLELNTTLAFDAGQIYNGLGLLVGLKWTLGKKFSH